MAPDSMAVDSTLGIVRVVVVGSGSESCGMIVVRRKNFVMIFYNANFMYLYIIGAFYKMRAIRARERQRTENWAFFLSLSLRLFLHFYETWKMNYT